METVRPARGHLSFQLNAGKVSGQSGRFQLGASWKRSARPRTYRVMPQVELVTQAFTGNVAISNSWRVANGQLARGHLCFQLKLSWKRKSFLAKLPFPTRTELETASPPADISVSNTGRVGNASGSGQSCGFQPGAG